MRSHPQGKDLPPVNLLYATGAILILAIASVVINYRKPAAAPVGTNATLLLFVHNPPGRNTDDGDNCFSRPAGKAPRSRPSRGRSGRNRSGPQRRRGSIRRGVTTPNRHDRDRRRNSSHPCRSCAPLSSAPAQRRSFRERDGSKIRSVELERLFAQDLALIKRRNSLECLAIANQPSSERPYFNLDRMFAAF